MMVAFSLKSEKMQQYEIGVIPSNSEDQLTVVKNWAC